jgi:hypothetical protein
MPFAIGTIEINVFKANNVFNPQDQLTCIEVRVKESADQWRTSTRFAFSELPDFILHETANEMIGNYVKYQYKGEQPFTVPADLKINDYRNN